MGVGEDGNVGVHGDVAEDKNGSGRLDCDWVECWDECWVSDEEDREVGKVISLVGSVDGIWSEAVLNGEENTWCKGDDAGNVWNFGGAVGESSKKKYWHFGLKNVAVADSDWDEDDWESVWTEGRFDLGKEDGGDDLINDDCDKNDNDNCGNDDCGDHTSCNASIIDVESLMH